MSHFNTTISPMIFKAACHNKAYAQEIIYQKFSTSVYNIILRITHNKTDALDLTQDVFIKVFTKIEQSKSPELLGFWIRRISINTTLSYIKKNAKLITNIDFKEKAIDKDVNETMSSLEYALSKLPAIARSILWMYEVEGMSHAEIANIHGKTISFSKTQLSRAKQMAQKYLTQKGGGYEAVQ